MHRGRTKLFLFFSFCLLLMVLPNIKAQAFSQGDENAQDFLNWYEEHKHIDYSTYRLQGDLHLSSGSDEQAIMLDGSGVLDLECNGFSIYVESNVVINHPNLYITTNRKAKGPLLILRNQNAQTNAKLTLQQGGIYGDQIGLQVLSGELLEPQGETRFQIVAGSDTIPAIDIQTSNLTLHQLDVYTSGSGKITAIQAKQDITLEDCKLQVNIEDDTSLGFGIHAGGKVQLKNTSVNVQGMHAQSVQSDQGGSQIHWDEQSILIPEIDLIAAEDAKYQMVNLSPTAYLNVPQSIRMDQLILASTLNCELSNLQDPTQPMKTMQIAVTWDMSELSTCLNTLGECTISGTLSQRQLEQEGIVKQASLQPKIHIKVVPDNAMNKIQVANIQPGAVNPFLEVYLLIPYGASQLQVQYSKDGSVWEDGYCLRNDQSTSTNLLECNDSLNGYLLTNLYVSKLEKGGMIRSVVIGGPFAGTSESVVLDMENLFTKPGEDGNGGNRGGSGQWEGERSVSNDQEEDDTLSKPSSTTPEEVIRETGATSCSSLPYILLIPAIYGCYLFIIGMKKNFTKDATLL